MATQVETTPNILRSDVLKIVENIALDNCLENFEIIVKRDHFTGVNYFGEISRIKIKSKCCEKSNINPFLKKAPTDESARKLGTLERFYKMEIFMYTDIIPAFLKIQEASLPPEERMSFAKFYSGIDDHMNELIIMNDLTKDGFIGLEKKTPQNLDHAKIVTKNLATFHAFSFAIRQENPVLFSRLSAQVPKTINYGYIMENFMVSMVDKSVDIIEEPYNRDKLKSLAINLSKELPDFLDSSLTEPFNVICHGDCWNNNMLFKYKDGKPSNVIFIDWQLCRISSPVTDLIYYICMSLDLEVFKNNLPDILNTYYDSLKTAASNMGFDLEACYPEEVFRKQFNQKAVYGLCVAIVGIPLIKADSKDVVTMGELVDTMDNRGIKDFSNVAKYEINELMEIFVTHDLI